MLGGVLCPSVTCGVDALLTIRTKPLLHGRPLARGLDTTIQIAPTLWSKVRSASVCVITDRNVQHLLKDLQQWGPKGLLI